jgi:alpha-galactosidase
MIRTILFVFLVQYLTLTAVQAQNIVLDNGLIRREIDCSNRHVTGKSFSLLAGRTQFIREQSPEFSLRIDDMPCSGLSEWEDVSFRDTTDARGGKGVILSLSQAEKKVTVELIYLLYPDLPVIYKTLRLTNRGTQDVKIEAVDVESLHLNWGTTETWVMRQYARYKWLGPYTGNWDDPLIIVHDTNRDRGIAIGNEAVGVIKRTTVFTDGRSVTAGLTHPDQSYGFRKWLRVGEQWTAPRVFTALYDRCPDASIALNTIVPDFVRKYANMRIEQLPRKPMFVYNTWVPFGRNIDEPLVKELAKVAAECGVEEFVIDDGWQMGPGSGGLAGQPAADDDWEVDRKKFPNGLRPVFDYIKSLGMKPGLWVSLATANFSRKNYSEHPEWFVQDEHGQIANLHTEHGESKTACMGTDWYDYIKQTILRLVNEHGLAYIKLDLAIETSAYVYDDRRTGCYATDHPYHRDHAESYSVIYERCMQLFDELHREAPDLFIDCTFETAGKLQLMDYGIAAHAEGNWLSNVGQANPTGPLRIRNLAWGRTPALPATSLVIGNLCMDGKYHELGFKSLTGSLPIMLGDPRRLTVEEKQRYKSWSEWLKTLEKRHAFMSFRQDLPGFGEPAEGCWDGFCRLNTDTGSGGLVGVFRHGAAETSRTVTLPWLDADKTYLVKQGFEGKIIATLSGNELSEKGFHITLDKKYDGELFEIIEKND